MVNKELTKVQKLQALKDFEMIVKKGDDTKKETDIFTEGLKHLMSPKDIELKTEYDGKNENFAGIKLTYLSIFGNMPQLNVFVNILEKKRVSLDRKGRKEVMMSLEKREKEVQIQHQKNASAILGY